LAGSAFFAASSERFGFPWPFNWIKPQALREDKVARLLAAAPDPGESEAIALALELPADLILPDERDGRSAAGLAGIGYRRKRSNG